MKKLTIVFLLCAIFFVSCISDKNETVPAQKPEQITLESLKGNYFIDDFSDYGLYALVVRASALNNALKDSNTFALVIGETEFELGKNPFNTTQYLGYIPSDFNFEEIKTGSIKRCFSEARAIPRDPDSLSIEKVWLEKDELNGTPLYEMTLVTYIAMKTGPNAFVYENDDVNDTLIRPSHIKNNAENAYTLQRYINARQVAAGHTPTAVLNFLRTQPDYETLIDFSNPNRVASDGTITAPDSRDRMRELGGFGTVTVDGTYTWHFVDNRTDTITISVKQSNLPTDACRKSELLRIQIKDIATQTFAETTPDSGVFETAVAYTTTESTELILNARFIATPPSTGTDFRLKAGNGMASRIIATNDATELYVADGITIAQIKSCIESVDGSAQVYTLTGQSGELTDETVLTPSTVATLTVQSRNGETKDFAIVTNATRFIRLEETVQETSVRNETRAGVIITWHDSIQEAADAASKDSTITVYEDEYIECVVLATDCVLQSATPSDTTVRDNTIINSNNTGNAVQVNAPATVKVQGVTLTTNVQDTSTTHSGVAVMDGAHAEITSNRIKGCNTGVFIQSNDTTPDTLINTVHNNIVEDNSGLNYAGIFVGKYKIARITDNTIQNNDATNYGGGIRAETLGRVQNTNGDYWLANLLPGTVQTAAEIEGVAQTNTFSGNSVNSDTNADGKDIRYTRTTAPTAGNIVAHASLDTVKVTATYNTGDIIRVYTAADATTDVASMTYEGGNGEQTLTINYDVQADTNYYVAIQGDIYKYAESTRTEKMSINEPDAPVLDSPSDGASNQSRASTLTWGAAARAVSYNVYLGTVSGSPVKVASEIAATQYEAVLDKDTTYYWKVESVDDNSLTNSSDEWSFTTNSDTFVCGDGSIGNPFGISTWGDLQEVRYQGSETHFKLMKDLSSSSSGYATYAGSSANGGAGWEPLNPTGSISFDGNGFRIKDLTINKPSVANNGLFGLLLSSATIKNLGVENVNITGGYNTGGLIGNTVGGISLENCYVTGAASGSSYIGGLCGYIAYAESKNCYSTVSVTARDGYGGGLCGYSSNVTFTNCYTAGSVNSPGRSGGFVSVADFDTSVFNTCYWNLDTSGQMVAGYTSLNGDETLSIPPLDSTQMRQSDNFSGWDFTTVWAIDEEVTFPYLRAVTPTTKPQ